MLFGPIVFMFKTLCRQLSTVIILSIFNFIIVTRVQAMSQRENGMKFSGDFETFLKDLGSLVYKSKKLTSDPSTIHFHQTTTTTTTTPHYKISRRSETMLNTQKAALRDVLMMKLVSYYEDKYKLAREEPTTIENFTFMRTQPNAKSVNNNKFNEVDGSERRYPTVPRYRSFEGRNMRRQFEEAEPVIPEVVII